MQSIVEILQRHHFTDKNTIAFLELCNTKKWQKKSLKTLENTIEKLSGYDEKFIYLLIQRAYINKWQGVIFKETPNEYLKWQSNTNQIDKILNAFDKL